MDARSVRVVLNAVRDSLAKSRGVTMDDSVLDEAIALADQFLPNRSFPDKGVDIIEQSVAHALASNTKVVDVAEMRSAVEALVGIPLDPTDRLAQLSTELRERALLMAASRTRYLPGWAWRCAPWTRITRSQMRPWCSTVPRRAVPTRWLMSLHATCTAGQGH